MTRELIYIGGLLLCRLEFLECGTLQMLGKFSFEANQCWEQQMVKSAETEELHFLHGFVGGPS